MQNVRREVGHIGAEFVSADDAEVGTEEIYRLKLIYDGIACSS